MDLFSIEDSDLEDIRNDFTLEACILAIYVHQEENNDSAPVKPEQLLIDEDNVIEPYETCDNNKLHDWMFFSIEENGSIINLDIEEDLDDFVVLETETENV